MWRIILALALLISASTATAQWMQPLLIGGSSGIVISITACGSNTCSYTPGTTNAIGQAVARLSTGAKYSGAWSMPTSGVDHTGAACPNNAAYFTISSTGLIASTPASTNQTAICIATVGKTPYVQLVSLTAGAGTTCSFGQTYPTALPAPAVAAGFNTCVLYADYNNSFWGNQSNWLSGCGGPGSVPTWVWHQWNGTQGNCTRIDQETDSSIGKQVLHIQWQTGDNTIGGTSCTSNCFQGLNWPQNAFTDSNPHLPPEIYLEMTMKLTNGSVSSPTRNPADVFNFWMPYGSHTNALEPDGFEVGVGSSGPNASWSDGWVLWGPSGSIPAYQCPAGACNGNPFFSANFTQYHKYAALFTSDGTTYSKCIYFDNAVQNANVNTGGSPNCGALNMNPYTVVLSQVDNVMTIWIGVNIDNNVDAYIQSILVASCSSGVPPSSGPCFGTVITNG